MKKFAVIYAKFKYFAVYFITEIVSSIFLRSYYFFYYLYFSSF